MDKIQLAIKCPNCSKILSEPVMLPCGHSICQEHTNVKQKQIVCWKCGKSHENNDFPINEPLKDIIAAQVAAIDLSNFHKDAKLSINRLEKKLTQSEVILNDPAYFVHESVTDLKNKVELKAEELKLLIDETSQKLLFDFGEYEKECAENIRTSKPNSGVSEFKKLANKTREKLTSWEVFLNELKYDEEKYKQIKTECNQCEKVLVNKFEAFKQATMMNK